MKAVLRLAWVFGLAGLGWYFFRAVPEEAWWGTAAGGVIGLLTSPEALGRAALVVGCAFGLPLFTHQVLGTPGDYWPFFLIAGAMIGRSLRLDLVAAALLWLGRKWFARRTAVEGKTE